MDKVIFLPTIAVGALLILAYIVLCHRADKKAELPTIINMVLSAGGLVGGGVLLAATVLPQVFQKLSEIKIYIFIAGVAVLYVSFQSVWKELPLGPRKAKAKSAPSETPDSNAVDTNLEKPNAATTVGNERPR